MRRAVTLAVSTLLALFSATTALGDDKHVCADAYEQSQSLRDAHRLLAARDELRVCARQECSPFAGGQIVKDCVTWLGQVEAALPSIVLEARNTDGSDVSAVRVTMDGQPFAEKLDGTAIAVDPGEHRFAFETAGLPRVEKQIVIREGERDRHERVVLGKIPSPPAKTASILVSPATPTPTDGSTQRTVGLVLVGVGGGGLVVGSVFGVLALSGAGGLKSESGCPKSCPTSAQPQIDTLHRDQWVSDVGLGVGVIGLGVGVVLLLTSHGPEAAPAAVSLDVGPGVVLLGGRF